MSANLSTPKIPKLDTLLSNAENKTFLINQSTEYKAKFIKAYHDYVIKEFEAIKTENDQAKQENSFKELSKKINAYDQKLKVFLDEEESRDNQSNLKQRLYNKQSDAYPVAIIVGSNGVSKNPRTTSITLQQKEADAKQRQTKPHDQSTAPKREIMTGAQLIKQTTLLYLSDKEKDSKNGFLKTATHQLNFDQADIDNFLNLQKNANFEPRGNSSTLDEKKLWKTLQSSLEKIPKKEAEEAEKTLCGSFFKDNKTQASDISNLENLSNLIKIASEAKNEFEPNPKNEPTNNQNPTKNKSPQKTALSDGKISTQTNSTLIFGFIPEKDFTNAIRPLLEVRSILNREFKIASLRFNIEFKKEMDRKSPNHVFAVISAVSAFVSSLQNSEKSKEK